MERCCSVPNCLSGQKIGIIGGTGFSNLEIFTKFHEHIVPTPFGDPSAPLIEGQINGVDCVLLPRHGHGHLIMPGKVNYRANILALKGVGCTHILVSTATGSLQEHIAPGDIIIIDNFIDRTTSRAQTCYDGTCEEFKGICHLPMEPAFCNRTRDILIETAKELNIPYHPKGTCVTIEGPRFSSKAESLMFRQWGGDVINMTTVPEVMLAKECGLLYASVALATDYDCWRSRGDNVCVDGVMATLAENFQNVQKVIISSITKIAQQNWTNAIEELQQTVESSILPS